MRRKLRARRKKYKHIKGKKGKMRGENKGEHRERSNHVCPVEVTTGLQVLIMC